ncbi:MAG: hypothetical protein AVDCRST_MAG01-01-4367, partial [uncultured Rubrobacteraceae bacterium]
ARLVGRRRARRRCERPDRPHARRSVRRRVPRAHQPAPYAWGDRRDRPQAAAALRDQPAHGDGGR